jgi:secondary thiamine-phosphate synthase enzyme
MLSFDLETHQRNEFVEITAQVRKVLQRSGVRQGICIVYCPHTTAALTINENADPDVVHDLLLYLERAVPRQQADFRHGEGNSDAHIKASLIGSSVTILVQKSELVLGRWQGIFFCEFDGPRTRTVHVQTLES